MQSRGEQRVGPQVHKQKDDTQQQDMQLDPADAAAIQWLRTFLQPDTQVKAVVSAADKAYAAPCARARRVDLRGGLVAENNTRSTKASLSTLPGLP